MKGKIRNADWNSIQSKVDQVLGDEFWQDIAEMIPVLGPRFDVYENKHEVVVIVELPGLHSTEDVHVTMNGSVLTVRGEIEAQYPLQEKHMLLSERYFGVFSRKINLPNLIYEEIRAKYHNGLLWINLTKTNVDNVKHIDIEHM